MEEKKGLPVADLGHTRWAVVVQDCLTKMYLYAKREKAS